LLEHALVEEGDAMGQRHRIHLVVRHIDGGDAELVLNALEIGPHMATQFEIVLDGAQILRRRFLAHAAGLPASVVAELRDAIGVEAVLADGHVDI
jgi:hypothetical protein